MHNLSHLLTHLHSLPTLIVFSPRSFSSSKNSDNERTADELENLNSCTQNWTGLFKSGLKILTRGRNVNEMVLDSDLTNAISFYISGIKSKNFKH